MLSRSSLRSTSQAFTCVRCTQRRSYAAAASSTFAFETSDAAGTKLVSRNVPGPTSTLALVSKAGSRYEWVPGLTQTLQNFAFKNTNKRFAVRIVRETEILGSEFFSKGSREAIVYGAKFFRDDLPYFVELLAEVAENTKYQQYVIDEVIKPTIFEAHKSFLANPSAIALEAAHGVAFHRGLGNSIFPVTLSTPASPVAEEVEAYAAAAYAKPNIALVGSGIEQAELSKWAGEFFSGIPNSAPAGLQLLDGSASKYYGGESRIDSNKGNAIVIAFPGTSIATGSAYKPEIEVLASLLGGESSIKWTPGTSVLAKAIANNPSVKVSTSTAKYSDTGLLYVTITGSSKAVSAAAKSVVDAIKSLKPTAEEVKKATSQAKFKSFDAETAEAPPLDTIGLSAITSGKVISPEEALKGLSSVSESGVSSAAKKLLDGKATFVAVGDLAELPYASELGLNV